MRFFQLFLRNRGSFATRWGVATVPSRWNHAEHGLSPRARRHRRQRRRRSDFRLFRRRRRLQSCPRERQHQWHPPTGSPTSSPPRAYACTPSTNAGLDRYANTAIEPLLPGRSPTQPASDRTW